MRNYCRVYHTSLDYLITEMTMGQLIAELEDAAEDLAEENRLNERRMKQAQAKAKSQRTARPRRRRR
ncbi:MAG: hypothetical protein IJ087_01695 [Eggerthellaceae bacterium]|nr:hypothetical protein [Eggerthellaceae bacterium]